ncbi:mitochondrial cardiolipin hydrolase [Apteryx rowi]|uniref:mitochondrial cardiolipin hydrolase n=1 Tax=Apteryx rowi TaxID=308060 RepID=UPI000E1D0B37|nr:mitochondrial cardiolipin hydrolase [Apteryx rowi]
MGTHFALEGTQTRTLQPDRRRLPHQHRGVSFGCGYSQSLLAVVLSTPSKPPLWAGSRAGIPVRHDQDNGFMHHKFAIVDKKMLITGSLNWTTQAIQNNRENVLIVEDAEYVKPFLAEFERIWEEYNPINYAFFSKENK